MKRVLFIKHFNLSIFLILTTSLLSGQNSLLIPDTISGTNFNMTLQKGSHTFLNGQVTQTMGINGSILGPTLILNKGDFIKFEIKNELDDSSTLHWHGMHVSSENDGGPHTVIGPNDIWEPEFTILDHASTYWYHPHLHKKTNEHVSKGISGLIIVRDTIEKKINLPRRYGVDDFPLIIQTKAFDTSGQILVDTRSDSIPMVNATINPILNVPAQVIRLRILNGSSQRSFNLGLNNGKDLYQIASDGGVLDSVFKTKRIPLAPGERCEILLDLDSMNGQTIQLFSYTSELPNGTYGATYPGMSSMMILDNYNSNPLNGKDYPILSLQVKPPTSNPITNIPLTCSIK